MYNALVRDKLIRKYHSNIEYVKAKIQNIMMFLDKDKLIKAY